MTDPANPRMHLRQQGQQQGPFDEDDVRRWYDAGELGIEVLSWRAGEPRWQSLGRRWPPARHRRAPRQWPASLIGVSLIATAVLVALPAWSFRVLPSAAQLPRVLWTLECALVALALLIVIVTGWRIRRRGQAPSVVFVTGAIVIALGAIVGFSLAKVSAPLLAYRLTQSNALVYFDPKSHDIVIKGAIGARLSDDLEGIIRAHPDAMKVLIRSQGGFVEDAFRAADVINAAQLPLEVVGYCASACVLLWAKVPQREMAPGAQLGLHQNRLEYDFDPALDTKVKDKLEVRSTEALQQAGFSSRLQRERSSTPPEKMFWVSVDDARSEGVAFNLVAMPVGSHAF